MNEIKKAIKTTKPLERLFLILTFLSVFLKHIFDVKETVDIVVFAMVLCTLYFPSGFYFLREPNKNDLAIPITSGFVYAVCVVAMIYNTLRVFESTYPIIMSAGLLLSLTLYLRSCLDRGDYLISHYLRIGLIMAVNLIVLL